MITVTFHALCEAEGCVVRRPRSMGELVANIYECNTPKVAKYASFTNGAWVLSCETHKVPNGNYSEMLISLEEIRRNPDEWRVPPQKFSSGWNAVFENVVEPMVYFYEARSAQ